MSHEKIFKLTFVVIGLLALANFVAPIVSDAFAHSDQIRIGINQRIDKGYGLPKSNSEH